MTLSLSLLVGALTLITVYLINKYIYWKRRGIPIVMGLIPPFGHSLPVISMKSSVSELHRKIYEDTKNVSMVGLYQMTSPALMVCEPQLVKAVLQTSFPKFHENALKINPEADPLLSHHPFFNSCEKWSIGRKRLTYAFSNMRLKILFATVKDVCKKFEDFMERRLKTSDKYETELKTFFAKFTGEVVSTAGLNIRKFE
ncbi:cytochrome P450 6g1-like [Hylaeus anthracinus]|uniref:cytochrome P450 6g1-like n=1 Tax=Hylaeus anthracinus TaxID=313031 RepID=UPI0023B8B47A|nr:cytochrome P450 6g1-like [Hylaeus anthracinus]